VADDETPGQPARDEGNRIDAAVGSSCGGCRWSV